MGRTRDTLFVSHASPEDNEFSRWLALRLAAEGYRVWSDITELLGGERFWDRAEEAIRSWGAAARRADPEERLNARLRPRSRRSSSSRSGGQGLAANAVRRVCRRETGA